MAHFVFDLDGVLIDSAPIIREAYRLAGVRPPENILAYEGVDWLVGQVGARKALQVRRRKNVFYLRALGEANLALLPPYHVARQLVAEHHDVHVLTGAPQGTLDVLRGRREWAWLHGRDQVRTPDKMRILTQLGKTGTYVDDQSRLATVPDGWRLVWYDRQEERELYRELLRKEE